MKKIMKLCARPVLCALVVAVLGLAPQSLMAQQGDLVEDSLKDITTVAVLGGVGALLGLSTLSFVEEPKDHFKNIVVGGAIGIIAGVGYVTYKQATVSKTVIKERASRPNYREMPTSERLEWHGKSLAQNMEVPSFAKANEALPVTSWTFSF